MAAVALGDIHRHFTWQAWHKLTSTVVLRGRRATDGTGWRAWSWLGARDAAAFCIAGVALGDIHRHFTWQAWHKLTSTVVLRGRRATDGIGWRAWSWLGARDAAAFCIAGVAQTHIYRRFAWQAWHKLTSIVVLRGRRATDGTGWRAWSWLGARDAAAFCVAAVALGDIHRHLPSATPAMQNAAASQAPNQDQARHPVPSVARLPRKTTVDVSLCHACHLK